jgi:glutamate carboxypeptidase
MVDDIERLVTCESPSTDLAAVMRSADAVAIVGQSVMGIQPERIVIDGRAHLLWRFGSGPAQVLLLGHHDTVWPMGSLQDHPFSVRKGILRGPGCFDMKAGLVIAFHAVAALPDPTGVTVLVTGDEEIGSPSSRGMIEAEAEGCRAALILEGAADNGALKTRRKGVSLYDVLVTGRAAHAGLEPEAGVNATVELAHQILAIGALADHTLGTTVTPTLLSAGSAANTVPAQGAVSVDVRAWSADEQIRVDAELRALKPVLDRARIEIVGGVNRPPLEASASADLFARAVVLAQQLGLDPLSEVAVGGGSDGNFTAGVGTPTLDGLGAIGTGAHADDEHVVLAAIPGRAALLAVLIADILTDDRPFATKPDHRKGSLRT